MRLDHLLSKEHLQNQSLALFGEVPFPSWVGCGVWSRPEAPFVGLVGGSSLVERRLSSPALLLTVWWVGVGGTLLRF